MLTLERWTHAQRVNKIFALMDLNHDHQRAYLPAGSYRVAKDGLGQNAVLTSSESAAQSPLRSSRRGRRRTRRSSRCVCGDFSLDPRLLQPLEARATNCAVYVTHRPSRCTTDSSRRPWPSKTATSRDTPPFWISRPSFEQERRRDCITIPQHTHTTCPPLDLAFPYGGRCSNHRRSAVTVRP